MNNEREVSVKKVDINHINGEDVFKLIGSDWMLVCAGEKENFNMMTASWGGIGWLWNKPVAFVFIRPERYTHEFVEEHDRMSLSFFSESRRETLKFCGSKSGRDLDKCKETGLSAIELESGAVTFEDARIVLDCRKLFKTSMDKACFIDKEILSRWYHDNPGGSLHDIYVVEIESVYKS
jgi:flavin reductase (DIM6/NTAB) family NADH-FMN oxidoreductase RutF